MRFLSHVLIRGNDIVSASARLNLASAGRAGRASLESRAKTQPRFYLKRGDDYLHLSGAKLTTQKADAYIGFAHQVEAIRRSIALAAECVPVEAPAPQNVWRG